ncbi:MAG: peptidyl-prolyl cis-trans isomerase [Gemmataceae bacterium]
MHATARFRRTLGLVALLAGCQAPAVGRAQSPDGPLAPVAPAAPLAPVAPDAQPAGFTAPPVKAAVAALAGDPRIKVVALVGLRNTVTEQEVWEAARQRVQDYINVVDGPGGKQTVVKDDAKAREVYNDELKRIVERELVLEEMEAKLKKAGKAAVMDDIKDFAGKLADRKLRDFKSRTKAKTDDDFRAALAVMGLTPGVVKRQIERQVMADEYVRNSLKERGRTVSLGDVRRYYDEHPDEYSRPEAVAWQHIFISAARFPTREAARQHAEKVRAEAAAGANFEALCKQHDHGIAANQRAEGVGHKRGEIQPAELEPVVLATPAGGVAAVVETPPGYHIAKVATRQEAGRLPFTVQVQDDIREKLMRKMQEAEYKRIVGELWQRGVVHFINNP